MKQNILSTILIAAGISAANAAVLVTEVHHLAAETEITTPIGSN